ncbi:hypothetical protein ACR9YC_04650 [Parasphingorhabdus sp. DH2-15]|uniref:hypothetical protein n=1 Tax=Parasphingorhabdus sp. DH2-15 TaxID=3444112 RepID=UPI003F685AB3
MRHIVIAPLLCSLAIMGLAACTPDTPEEIKTDAKTIGAPLGIVSGTAAGAAAPSQFLALSDVHFGVNANDTCFTELDCETSKTLWDSTIAEAKTMASDPSVGFILYTGDLPAHSETLSNRKTEFVEVYNGLAAIAEHSGKRLIYLPGNNDSYGNDYCTFTYGGKKPYDALPADQAEKWPAFAGKDDIIDDSGLKYGYYSIYPMGKPAAGTKEPQLRVIALNTVMFTEHYESWCPTMDDATQQSNASLQMQWLAAQLKDAQTARKDSKGNVIADKVILAMHVPPGTDGFGGIHGYSYTTEWRDDLTLDNGEWVQKSFLKLVGDYADIITGLASAHTHLNGIRRIRDCDGNFVALDMSIPAVTTDHGSNPTLRLVRFGADYEWTGASTRYASGLLDLSSKTYSYAWNESFTFDDNYPCPNCDGSETLQQHIGKMSDKEVLSGMIKYLKVAPGYHRTRMYDYALDTSCSPNKPSAPFGG